MASPPQPIEYRRNRRRAPQSDDVLQRIFLFLDSPADLARACATSPTFRRIITDPCFLRRFRALHPPPLLGVVSRSIFLPAEPPHPSAAAAHAFVNGGGAVEFHCSFFLPSPGPWYYLDTHDGRDLFYADHVGRSVYSHYVLSRRLAVCDPVHQRYRVLPAIPEDLAALVDHRLDPIYDREHFLAPPAEDAKEKDDSFHNHPRGHDDNDDEPSPSSPFRVITLMQCVAKLVLFVFSSSGAAGGKWQAVMFDRSDVCNSNGGRPLLLRRYYMHGRFCWPIMPLGKKLLVLDARRTMLEISTLKLPSYFRYQPALGKVAFVEAIGEQERPALFTIHKHREHDVYHLLYAVMRDNDDGDDQWESEAIIYLPLRHRDYRFVGVAGGYVLLEGWLPEGRHDCTIKRPDCLCVCFSLDLQTLQLQWFCENMESLSAIDARPYVGFPPYLSPPIV